MIFSLVQTKGGVGKSTISKLLTFSKAFKNKFDRIALVELDTQGSLYDFFKERPPEKIETDHVHFFPLGSASDNVITESLTKISTDYDLVVLDIPGESVARFATKLALNISDLVLIPIRASVNDEKAFTRQLLPAIEPALGKIPFYILPNFIHHGTKKQNIVTFYNDWLPEGISCLDSYISQRKIYEEFNDGGTTLSEYVENFKNNKKLFSLAKKSEEEIEMIAAEIVNIELGR